MVSLRMPEVRFLPKTNLSKDYQHSILISMLRGLAAVEVVAAHLRAQFFTSLKALPDPTLWYQVLAFFTGFAHQAVVVFFLLSGWLVGGSLLNKLSEPGIMISYAIDRITRMWIVLIPAFLLTLLLGAHSDVVDISRVSHAWENEYSVIAFIGNLIGLQDMAVPRFGGNFSLWSLANEMWYYVLFPLFVVGFAGKTSLTKAASLVTGCLVVYLLSFKIVLFFVIWLLGVAFSRIQIDTSRSGRVLLLIVFAGVSVYYRMTGSNDILVPKSFIQDFLFSLTFLLLLSSLQFPADRNRMATRIAMAVGARLAAFSFTLYVIHVPLLSLLRHTYEPLASARLSPDSLGDFMIYAAMLVIIMVLAYLFHLPFEAQTYRVRGVVKAMVSRWRSKRATVAAYGRLG